MKSVFLAGGKGTRLAPLTDNLPKPMVPILGVPHLHRMLEGLKDAGINIFNSDILADIDYQQLLKHHYSKHADVTIVGTWLADPTPWGHRR